MPFDITTLSETSVTDVDNQNDFEIQGYQPTFVLLIYLFIWGFTSLSTLYRLYHDG